MIAGGMTILEYTDVPIWGFETKYGYTLFEKFIQKPEFGWKYLQIALYKRCWKEIAYFIDIINVMRRQRQGVSLSICLSLPRHWWYINIIS